MKPGYSVGDKNGYVYPFKARIVDYVVNGAELQKWMHVIIPTNKIFAVPFTPDVLVLATNVNRTYNLKTIVHLPGTPTDEYSNVIGVDKIFLSPVGTENRICSGTWPPKWLTDLDDSSGQLGYESGKAACESTPGYGWTGKNCCGDDTGNDTRYVGTVNNVLGPVTHKEFFADTAAGCWAGRKMVENSRAMLVDYNISYAGYNGEINRSCTGNNCTYPLPASDGVYVVNNYPEEYDMVFVDSSRNPIKQAGIAPDSYSFLKVENVPLRVLYLDEKFWSCNAKDFVTGLKNSETRLDLIPQSNRIVSDGQKCYIKGDFFCDDAESSDTGWSGESVGRYITSAVIARDGNEIDIGDSPTVAATYRNETKHNYNLIRNGGFENV
jgi:hypothetical protein